MDTQKYLADCYDNLSYLVRSGASQDEIDEARELCEKIEAELCHELYGDLG